MNKITNISVLLIEDEPGDADLLRLQLQEDRRSTYEINGAASLAAAKQQMDKGLVPDIVLLDLNLPDSIGPRTVQCCRELTDAPIVVLTGLDSIDATSVAIESGADDYLTKGGDANALHRAIHYTLMRHHRDVDMRLAATVFSHAREGVFITDAQGNIADVNEGFCQITGYSRQEAIGRNPRFLKSGRHDREFYTELWTQLLLHNHWSGEMWNRRKDGELILEQVSISVVRNQRGDVHNFVCFRTDITERKVIESALKLKSEEMERFIGIVSHDLRSPLITIQSFLELIEKAIPYEVHQQIDRDLDYIKGATERMDQLLSALLQFTRFDQAQTLPRAKAFSAIIGETLLVLNGLIKMYDVEIIVEPSLLILHGDILQLGQIWQNLIENAVKYRSSQVRPTIEIGTLSQQGERVFFVRDNGIGIKKENLDRVFDLFAQLDRSNEGAGLGLALVKKIISLYNGRIWAESEGAGRGSCFYFTLPLATV